METSLFHSDEREAQALAGGGASGAGIRAFMPDQHQAFFAQLPYLFAGVIDPEGWPVATILTGAPGFVHALDPTHLRIEARTDATGPISPGLVMDGEVGLLGLDLATRRRNRANGRIASVDAAGFEIRIAQSFGNCAKYIQRRDLNLAPERSSTVEVFDGLGAEAKALIQNADTFFVASHAGAQSSDHGVDISHRGGRPGFVKIDGDTLVIPDFAGNRFYNTLGNFLGEPRAGLLFVDFDRGDLLHLKGEVEIDWSDRASRLIQGAERSWRFRTLSGSRRRGALSLHWSKGEASPATDRTGIWTA